MIQMIEFNIGLEGSRHIFSIVFYHVTYSPKQVFLSVFLSLINQECFQNPELPSTLRSLDEKVLRVCIRFSLYCSICHGISVYFSSKTKLALRGRYLFVVPMASFRDVSPVNLLLSVKFCKRL